MSCSAAAYDTLKYGHKIRRELLRRRGLAVNVYRCEACDKFHLRPTGSSAFGKKPLAILNQIALGYTKEEIARNLGLSTHTVDFHVRIIYECLGTSKMPNAVAIGISLGYLNPNEFVPVIEERDTDGVAQRNSNGQTVQREGSTALHEGDGVGDDAVAAATA